MVRTVVLACGRSAGTNGPSEPFPLFELSEREGAPVRPVPARPGRAVLDGLLGELAGGRLVVAGTDADLAAVVLRLLRTDRLAEVAVGYLPAERSSQAAAIWGLPADPERALGLALRGEPDRVPLIRDDAGGVLVGLGTIGPVRGVGYCDDTRVLRGPAKLVRVSPALTGPGLVVSVRHGGLWSGRRAAATLGRSFEIGCLPTTVTTDGVPHERETRRWTWYRHTEDLRVIRGR